MARQARGEYLDPSEVQVVHAVQRCVRRAFLCGKDPLTGKSFEHRRQWIRDRLEFLASVFGVDCLTYTVMSNHLHVVLRSRPDVVKEWSDDDVARRWWRLFPKRRDANKAPAEPHDHELAMITGDVQKLAEIRKRLSDVSWWMRCTAENIARRSNKEDQCTGRFWEGRYRAVLLLDETSLLACAAYVDLNPVRAAMAKTPEASKFTGAKDRIDDLKTRSKNAPAHATQDWERSRRRQQSGWLSPIEINERTDKTGPNLNPTNRRASQKGFLSIPLAKYLDLLDWTGRQLRLNKRGSIPDHLAPILERLGINGECWCDLVQKFGKLFKRAAGSAESLAHETAKRNQNYMHAPGTAMLLAS